MDEKRIKLAEDNFRRYLNDNLIKKSNFQSLIYQTYLKKLEQIRKGKYVKVADFKKRYLN